MKNWKTTAAGILTALGLGGFVTQAATREGQLALLTAAIGALINGWAARDANPNPIPLKSPDKP